MYYYLKIKYKWQKSNVEENSEVLFILQKSRSARRPLTVTVLIHVAFVIGVGVAAAPFRHVGHALVKVGQRHRVLFVDVALHVCLQQWALIIWKGHGEEGFWITHKFVDISLSSHLRETRTKKPILMWDVGMVPKLRIVSVLQEIQISNHYILHWKQGHYVNYTSIKTHTHKNTTSSSPFPNGECRERNEQKHGLMLQKGWITKEKAIKY